MPSRHLAAIMFADIMGYTALMEDNEARAISLRDKFSQTLHIQVTAYNGRILKVMGDGALCVFNSTIEAIKAALAIQKQMQVEPKVPLRIGIHTGDVIFEESDVYGDGVNIASRVESFAVSGGIFISGKAYDDIKNQKDIQSVSLGRFSLKNVKEPVEIFAISNPGLIVPKKTILFGKGHVLSTKKKVATKLIGSALLLIVIIAVFFTYKKFMPANVVATDRLKAIAVLPFRNESSTKAENEYFCNGMMEAVLNNLSQLKALHVISRQSVEQYRDSKKSIRAIANELGVGFILEGSVQRIGNKVKITTELIDANVDQQLWSDNFPGNLDDVFSLQEDIAQQIAGALQVKIAPDVQSRISRVPSKNSKALDIYYEAQLDYVKYAYILPQNDSDYNKIQMLCNQSIALDTDLAEAYVLKAKNYWDKKMNDWQKKEPNFKDLNDSVAVLCQKALAIDNNSADVLVLLHDYYNYTGKKNIALNYLRKAIANNPNHFEANLRFGEFYSHSDNTIEKALHYFYEALKLDPQSILTPIVYNDLWMVYMNICDYERARYYVEKSISQDMNIAAKRDGLYHMVVLNLQIGTGDEVLKNTNEQIKYDSNALYFAAEAYCVLKNNCSKAVQLYELAWRVLPNHINEHRYAIALWKTGRKQDAINWMNVSLAKYKRYDSLGGIPINNYDVAGIYAFLGNKKAAYDILKRPPDDNYVWGWGSPYLIQRDPLFDNIRNEKEFQDILKNVLEHKRKLRERIQELDEKGEL